MPSSLHHRARVASLARHRQDDDPELANARRELATENLAAHIKRVVDAAPPLNSEQLERLRALLPPVAPGGAA
ncbi:hypothetical protein PV736_02200 [Streptomyces scabiei]|uniref:hypothetical protein n=1 Tax=Streptomyces scabiei TaxID=1930 RepID=UPI00099F7C9D|nr:hypothetical protein [Streptomyces scabiei]MDX2657874.1 hypothetical protein [Streptomyces scabiei]MDX2724514.1 hypothetical protein [Streptomyces scabiei]MDX2869606.1 hypothetical protein [Streptomyces scabiei]MDX2887980.1 hypothetical protein [Streptomyces scabiei]MDX2891624.1 hypothetical protein [Streptomyces scabiei]